MEKIYLITRRDLPQNIRLVQTNHATFQLWQEFHDNLPKQETPNLVCYKVENERELHSLYEQIYAERIALRITKFQEPDLGDQLTAIAYFGEKIPLFNGLSLV